MRTLIFLLAATALNFSSAAMASGIKTTPEKATIVQIVTSKGKVKVQLYDEDSKATVENFKKYIKKNFYDGTIFHRVIPNFMIQGGGFTNKMVKKDTLGPIKNEATNGLSNLRGTLAMARTNDIDSATAQFFINTRDNFFLDHQSNDQSKYGYAVFGKVLEGMEVVDSIEKTPTTSKNMMNDVPISPIVIENVKILQEPKNSK